MISQLTALLRNAVERRFRNFLVDATITIAVVLLLATGAGFVTFAAFARLRSIEGPVIAALIIAAAYALAALALASIRIARRRADRLRSKPVASMQTSAVHDEPSTNSSVAPGVTSEVAALADALKLGGQLSTMQLLVLALVGGLVAGRNVRK